MQSHLNYFSSKNEKGIEILKYKNLIKKYQNASAKKKYKKTFISLSLQFPRISK